VKSSTAFSRSQNSVDLAAIEKGAATKTEPVVGFWRAVNDVRKLRRFPGPPRCQRLTDITASASQGRAFR